MLSYSYPTQTVDNTRYSKEWQNFILLYVCADTWKTTKNYKKGACADNLDCFQHSDFNKYRNQI